MYKTYFGEALDCNIIDIQNKISQSTDSIQRPERSNSQSYAHEPLDTRIHDKAKKEKKIEEYKDIFEYCKNLTLEDLDFLAINDPWSMLTKICNEKFNVVVTIKTENKQKWYATKIEIPIFNIIFSVHDMKKSTKYQKTACRIVLKELFPKIYKEWIVEYKETSQESKMKPKDKNNCLTENQKDFYSNKLFDD